MPQIEADNEYEANTHNKVYYCPFTVLCSAESKKQWMIWKQENFHRTYGCSQKGLKVAITGLEHALKGLARN